MLFRIYTSNLALLLALLFCAQNTLSQDRIDTVYHWSNVADSVAFSARDSSPNACLFFNSRVWILSGWRYENNTYHSRSDVWSSANGVDWTKELDSANYHPYSEFIVFKGKMWAFDSLTYSSIDGREWKIEATNIPFKTAGRIVSIHDKLVCVVDSSIYYSKDGKKWKRRKGNSPWGVRYWFGLHSFKGKIYYFGGGLGKYADPKSEKYFNDVWSSVDGEKWKLETSHAEWEGRYWFSSIVFDNKLWLLGGWDVLKASDENFGNKNETWYSEDGVSWKKLSGKSWSHRHAQYTWVMNNALWISSGYGGGGNHRLYNDVWKLNKGY
jgi:hypothetical protein